MLLHKQPGFVPRPQPARLSASPRAVTPPPHRLAVCVSASRLAVGIDLGTTSSAIALINEHGKPYILQDDAGKAIIPSVVTYTPDGGVLVGQAAQQAVGSRGAGGASDAQQQAGVDPAAHFYSVKRLMGCKFSAIQDLVSKLSYPVVEGPGGVAAIAAPYADMQPGQGNNSVLMPQDVSAHVLRHLLLRAEAAVAPPSHNTSTQNGSSSSSSGNGSSSNGGSVSRGDVNDDSQGANRASTSGCHSPSQAGSNGLWQCAGSAGQPYPFLKHIHEAVITVPAYFNPAQRAATLEAGKAAGLKRVSLLQEPVAAAMAYGYGNQGDPNAYDTLLVFDLGGGTFDVSVLEGFEGILEVLATDGDAELGGDDYTRALAGLAILKARHHGSQSKSSVGGAQGMGSSSSSSSSQEAFGGYGTESGSPANNKNNSGSSHSVHLDDERASSGGRASSSSASGSGSSASSSGASGSGSSASSAVAISGEGSLNCGSSSGGSESGSGTEEGVFGASRSLLSTLTPPQRLAVMESAEGAKQVLGGSTSSSTQHARVEVPEDSERQGASQASTSSAEAQEVWAPLMARLWKPLYRLAMETRTQYGGRLPAAATHSFTRDSSTDPGAGGNSSSNKSSWEFHMFPPPPSEAPSPQQKYVAPPRRLTGLVLVGGSTRMPCIRDFIREITGMEAAGGVNPEEVVALGAALQAGVLVGSVGAGAELADGSYISGMHGRTTGITDAGAGEAAPWQP